MFAPHGLRNDTLRRSACTRLVTLRSLSRYVECNLSDRISPQTYHCGSLHPAILGSSVRRAEKVTFEAVLHNKLNRRRRQGRPGRLRGRLRGRLGTPLGTPRDASRDASGRLSGRPRTATQGCVRAASASSEQSASCQQAATLNLQPSALNSEQAATFNLQPSALNSQVPATIFHEPSLA